MPTPTSLKYQDAAASVLHTVPSWRLMGVLQCSRWTLRNYEKRGFIPEGRLRPGVPGKFYTEAQANCLLRLLGRQERIHTKD